MVNVLEYFNVFLRMLFGGTQLNSLRLLAPDDIYPIILSAYSSYPTDLISFLLAIFHNPTVLFSVIVWVWFAWLTIHLLLIWPFKWLRSVVKR